MLKGVIPKTKKEYLDFFAGASAAAGALALAPAGVAAANEAGYVKTVLTFNNKTVPIVDAAGVVARVALKILDLPEGLIAIAGATANLALEAVTVDPEAETPGVSLTWDGDFGIGSAAAAADATLTGTEQNIIPTTATPQAVAGATTAKGVSTAALQLDGTAAAVDIYLNVLIDDVDQDVTSEPANLVINGTVTLVWSLIGDK